MAEFMMLPIPAEDYNALGIFSDSVIQTYVNPDGTLMVRAVAPGDMEEFVCDGDCEGCPCCANCDHEERGEHEDL
jgi:hypothetical protein